MDPLTTAAPGPRAGEDPELEDNRSPAVHYDTRLPQLSRWQRWQIPIIASAGYWMLRTLGPTVRFEVLGWQHAERVYAAGQRCIWSFWHRSIFSVTWWARHRGVVVMNSTNFDGQWTRRVIERLGYGTAQGSSTRGGLRGLAVMAQRLEQGLDVAFTIDGPRGPRYVAKPGPVLLARRTGCPILVFHVGLENAWTLAKTWDLFQIPHPFSRAVMVFAAPIGVPADADRDTMAQKHAEMQSGLERVRDLAESWFALSLREREQHRATWNA
ncbi:MAG: lysophospholipid acyltransferase family protein [Acidobacteria bacterium]|nr:lysophospholipid acyltransferase family protein [Acidobacteriota bacterium]